MHQSSYDLMTTFSKTWAKPGMTVLDVGAYDVNGSYRKLFPACLYTGVDLTAGPNVDQVVQPYSYPFPDNHFDIVISGQALEHSPHPWKMVTEMARVLRPGGVMCLIAPWSWVIHRHPLDCFRILPDGMLSMLVDAQVSPLQCFSNETDTYAVAVKPETRHYDALALKYQQACSTPGDIVEHLPMLCAYAARCQRVTEMGTRYGNSTVAFLAAQPLELVCYDISEISVQTIAQLRTMTGRTKMTFYQKSVLEVEIEPTDLLFIDTYHIYPQLQQELQLHAGKVKKWIILHDTESFGVDGEPLPGQTPVPGQGIMRAVHEFLAANQGSWSVEYKTDKCNGLMVLQRTQGE
jgi:hypothetical protein